SHGLLVALPAFLQLDAPWLWLGLGITASSHGEVWLAGMSIVVLSWILPGMRKEGRQGAWHPLGETNGPWPAADWRRLEPSPAPAVQPTPAPEMPIGDGATADLAGRSLH